MFFRNSQYIFLQASHGSDSAGVEKDKPAAAFITMMSITLVVMLAMIWFVFEGLMWTTSSHLQGGFLQDADMKHAELRSAEESQVHQYDVADKDKGFYQIPIEQAIDRLVQSGSLEIR